MSRTALLSLFVGAALLGACAHQPDDGYARSKAHESHQHDDRHAGREDMERCRAMTPSAGRTANGSELAVTDCDMMAVDQAISQQEQDTQQVLSEDPLQGPTDALDSGVRRLPTTRRLGL